MNKWSLTWILFGQSDSNYTSVNQVFLYFSELWGRSRYSNVGHSSMYNACGKGNSIQKTVSCIHRTFFAESKSNGKGGPLVTDLNTSRDRLIKE